MYEMLVGNAPFYSPNIQQMYNKIQYGKLEFPSFITDEPTRSILTALLEKDPTKRLSDPAKMKMHSYFKGVDWDQVLQKELIAPYIPNVKDENDVSMIDPQFLREKVTLDDITQSSNPIDQSVFEDFSFYGRDDENKTSNQKK